MCGIAGVFRRAGGADDAGTVRAMLSHLRRRGPDAEGLERDGPVTLGHRRLAVLDLSETGRQPMRSASGRYLISYNGEVYNFQDLRRQLGFSAQDLRSTSDTEVVLLAWERWGAAALERMAGQWAFALYDREERRLWLCRDRFGEKPLFYCEGGGAFAFASSIPSLLEVPWAARELDQDALAEYLTLRYVVSPRTVVSGIRKLPPGHLLSVGSDGVGIREWYSPRFSPLSRGARSPDRRERIEEFGRLLVQAAQRCAVSDVPVGLLLSDGIDSNSIRSALASSRSDLPCFTYERSSGSPSSVRVVRTDAEGVSDLESLRDEGERLKMLIPAFSSFTEPVGDGAALATWLLIRAARPHATVFLCGHGGDEVLGGYRLSQDRFRLAAIRRCAFLPTSWLGSVLARHTYGAEGTAIRRRNLWAAPVRRVPEIARYLIHRPLPAGDLQRLYAPNAVPGGYLQAIDRLYGGCADEATDLDRIQEVLLRTFLPENILTYADSVAMDSSAELRMPFLDRDLVEFVMRLPPRLRVGRWPGRVNTKKILRGWGRKHLTTDVMQRPKRTFPYGPISHLLRERSGEVRGVLLDSGPLRRELPGLEAWMRRPPESFRGPEEGTLWALLALAAWGQAAGVR